MQAFAIILTSIISSSMVAMDQFRNEAKSTDQYPGAIGWPGQKSNNRYVNSQIFNSPISDEAYQQNPSPFPYSNPSTFPSSSTSIFEDDDFLEDVKPSLQDQWTSTADNFLTGHGDILPLLLTPAAEWLQLQPRTSENTWSEVGLSGAGMNLKHEPDFDNGGIMENHKFMDNELVSCWSSEMPVSIDPAEQRRRVMQVLKTEMIEKKRIRMSKNRESAARSRARKQALVRRLEEKVYRLKKLREYQLRKKACACWVSV